MWGLSGGPLVDWICGLGAITLGHHDADVLRAVRRQVDAGMGTWSLPSPLEAEVAERLCAIIPCAEMVRFVSTGSEATEAAVRVARMATGRERVLTIGYHSWFSTFSAVRPIRDGIPACFSHVMTEVPYNDLDAVRAELASTAPPVAAVILEPVLFDAPAPGYLDGLQALCRETGVLVIFDEVVTGFRWARGGAQEYFGVTPDLATFGKGLANGLPIGVLVGRRDLMAHAWVVSGTFGGHPLSLAAANAVLDVYDREDVCKGMAHTGAQFMEAISAGILASGAPARVVGYPVHPRVEFTTGDPEQDRLLLSLWWQEMVGRGVLLHPAGWNVSRAHTWDVAALRGSCEAAGEAMGEVAAAWKEGDVAGRLQGPPIEPALAVRADSGHLPSGQG